MALGLEELVGVQLLVISLLTIPQPGFSYVPWLNNLRQMGSTTSHETMNAWHGVDHIIIGLPHCLQVHVVLMLCAVPSSAALAFECCSVSFFSMNIQYMYIQQFLAHQRSMVALMNFDVIISLGS